jgi:shikimate 5-dehydrogenase
MHPPRPASQTPATAGRRRTFTFIGVSTGGSAIVPVFPRWMQLLGRPDVILEGVDLRIHDAPRAYRAVVERIRSDPDAMGGLVTTHKIDLLDAARDLFDVLDPHARILGEVSCISKGPGGLIGHAKDPITAGLSLDAILEGHGGAPSMRGREVLCFGAGGSGAAIALHLMGRSDRPGRVVVVNRTPSRLDRLRTMVEGQGTDIRFEYHPNEDPGANDRLLGRMPPGSLVINATGMGKDRPGSPISDGASWPEGAIAWELNYRGELRFLRQASAQASSRGVSVEDGWVYFLHGWTQIVAEVLHVELSRDRFVRMATIAEAARAPAPGPARV